MKILFVDLIRHYYDQHGVYSLAAVIKTLPGAQVGYIAARRFDKAIKLILRSKPDLIFYSSFSPNLPIYAAFDALLKKTMNVPSLIGGPGPTYDWPLLKGTTFDAICLGEGEYALKEFIQNGLRPAKNIIRNGEAFPKEFYPFIDLDRIPLPERSIIYEQDSLLREMPSKQFLSGRGCPYHCTYCFNHVYEEMFKTCGMYVRKKSVDYLLEEIADVKKKYPLQDVCFNDDVFILDKKWFWEFAEKFPRNFKLNYTCNVRANLINEDIVRALKQSGCRAVNWSIETGNERLRNVVLKRQMRDEMIYQTAGLLKKYKITFRIGNLLGIPGETLGQMDETIAMNIRARPFLAQANIFVPYTGLELTNYAIEKYHYFVMPVDKLPKNYFARTVMNIPSKMKRLIRRRLYLFPFFVEYPALFFTPFLKRLALSIPECFTQPVYKFVNAFKLRRVYLPKITFKLGIRIAYRHFHGEQA
ncbi:MAG: radical SAM protein [Candidatus Omnitrophota bacterium]